MEWLAVPRVEKWEVQKVAMKACELVGMWAISSVGMRDAQEALSTAGQRVCGKAAKMVAVLVLKQVASRVATKADEKAVHLANVSVVVWAGTRAASKAAV